MREPQFKDFFGHRQPSLDDAAAAEASLEFKTQNNCDPVGCLAFMEAPGLEDFLLSYAEQIADQSELDPEHLDEAASIALAGMLGVIEFMATLRLVIENE